MVGIAEGSMASRPATSADPVFVFGRERRMHARAYDYWVSLLNGRSMPAVSDLDPARLGGFAGHSVLIDLVADAGAPVIVFLGDALREEAEIGADGAGLADIPPESLLGRLLARFPDITARCAPVGFEAEAPGKDGGQALHRGILLPLAAADGSLGAIYGVVNWKRMAVVADAPDILAAVDSALGVRPVATGAPAWGDGPGTTAAADTLPPQPLDQQLYAARTWAALAEGDRTRGATALHAALGAAYDFLIAAQADADGFAALADRDDAGEAQASHAIGLVFGPDLCRRDRAAFVATLRHAQRLGLGRAGLAPLLDRHAGGHEALATAERRARRLARQSEQAGISRAWLSDQPVLGEIALMPLDPDFFVLIGRRASHAVEVVARMPQDRAMTEAALARVRAA